MATHPRVEFDFSNLSEIEQWHQNHEVNTRFLLGFHAVSSHIAAPTTVFAPGAEVEIFSQLASKKPTMLALTHHHWTDPINAAAAIHIEPALHLIEGRTIIPAKLSLINTPLIGQFITQAGATPAFREKDFKNYYKRQGLNESEVGYHLNQTIHERKDANRRLRQIESDKLNGGKIYASFVESERNKGNHAKLQPVKKGFQKVAEGLEHSEDCKIICIGFDYSGVVLPRLFSPTIFVDIMNAVPTDDITERLQDKLQRCVKNAIETCHENKTPNATKASLVAGALGVAATINRRTSRS